MSLEDLLLLHSRLSESVRGGKGRLEVALQSRHLLSLLEGKLIEVRTPLHRHLPLFELSFPSSITCPHASSPPSPFLPTLCLRSFRSKRRSWWCAT